MQLSPVGSSLSPLFASALAGINRGLADADRAGEAIAGGSSDVVGSMVDLLQSEMLVKLNAVTIRTGDEILGTLLDRKV